jgi:uncharacterized protein YjbI with pentapeptide repeats
MTMFNQKPCAVPGCPNHAVSFRDVCYNHIEAKEAYLEEIRTYVAGHSKFIGLNFAYVPFEKIDMQERLFLLVDFNHCVFKDMASYNQTLHMCFFDYTVFDSCKLISSKHTNCVFAGTQMRDTIIKDANMLQNNFNNCVLKNVSFTEADLYNSRFLASRMDDTVFHDCNLKNVDFRRSLQRNVTFKYSNCEDAIFDEKDEA